MLQMKTVLLSIALGIVLACSPSLETHSTDLPSATDAIRERGKLVMLCFPTLAGGISPNLAHGTTHRVGNAEHFIGFEVALIQLLADRLEVELEIRTLSEPGYGPLIPAMLDGQADLIASTLSVTPDREKLVDFSIPYDFAYQVVVTRVGDGIQSKADLTGRTAVAVAGSSHHQHLHQMGIDDGQIHFVDFVEEYLTAVAEGDADYAVVDSYEPDHIDELQNHHAVENLKVAFALPEMDRIATAVPNDSDLKEHLDALILELEKTGRLEELKEQAKAERSALR